MFLPQSLPLSLGVIDIITIIITLLIISGNDELYFQTKHLDGLIVISLPLHTKTIISITIIMMMTRCLFIIVRVGIFFSSSHLHSNSRHSIFSPETGQIYCTDVGHGWSPLGLTQDLHVAYPLPRQYTLVCGRQRQREREREKSTLMTDSE